MADEPIDLAAAREQTLEVIRKEYPPLLTSAHVAEFMQCTIWEVRDQVHRGELLAVRWGKWKVMSSWDTLMAPTRVCQGFLVSPVGNPAC